MMFNHTLISLTCGVQGHQQPGSQIHLHTEDKEEIQGPHATLVNLTLCLIGLLWASYKLHAISFVTILCFFTFFLPEYYFVLVNYSCRVIFIIYDNYIRCRKKERGLEEGSNVRQKEVLSLVTREDAQLRYLVTKVSTGEARWSSVSQHQWQTNDCSGDTNSAFFWSWDLVILLSLHDVKDLLFIPDSLVWFMAKVCDGNLPKGRWSIGTIGKLY